jgi:hypothetical protein
MMNGDKQIGCQDVLQSFPGRTILRLQQEEQVIETSLKECSQVMVIYEFEPITKQPDHLTVGFGVGDQLRQIIPQRRLAAGQDNMWNSESPRFIEDPTPLLGR